MLICNKTTTIHSLKSQIIETMLDVGSRWDVDFSLKLLEFGVVTFKNMNKN